MESKERYQCWFCGEGIDPTDADALMFSVESLWRGGAGSRNAEGPRQSIYAHSKCAEEKMRGAITDLDPGIFGEGD